MLYKLNNSFKSQTDLPKTILDEKLFTLIGKLAIPVDTWNHQKGKIFTLKITNAKRLCHFYTTIMVFEYRAQVQNFVSITLPAPLANQHAMDLICTSFQLFNTDRKKSLFGIFILLIENNFIGSE